MKVFIFISFIFNLSQTFGFECGKVQQAAGLIHGGSATTIERWPFSASLHFGDDHKFFCGATIISQQHILTGATCILEKYSSESLNPKDVKVSVGHSDLSKLSSVNYLSVKKIIAHPDWNTTTQNYDADIAVVVLEQSLVFTNKIQPACVPKDNSIAAITSGYVIGWGKTEDESKFHEEVLHHARTEVVNDTVCFLTNRDLVDLASYRTFCAGGKGKGPCVGDSGSGMFVKVGNAWSLKGITAAALINSEGECNTEAFAVFTDVYKFYEWVKEVIGTAALSK